MLPVSESSVDGWLSNIIPAAGSMDQKMRSGGCLLNIPFNVMNTTMLLSLCTSEGGVKSSRVVGKYGQLCFDYGFYEPNRVRLVEEDSLSSSSSVAFGGHHRQPPSAFFHLPQIFLLEMLCCQCLGAREFAPDNLWTWPSYKCDRPGDQS